MDFDEVRSFLKTNHRGVVNTFQPDGSVQSSIVVTGAMDEKVVFVSVNGASVKVRNLRREPRCTVLAVTADWRQYVVAEGRAQLFDSTNSEPEALRMMLRDTYRACGDRDHPDWDEYDRVMRRQDAVVAWVHPQRVYGLLR
jgi:PPOX class probable F420-dependent enzyme